MGVYNGVKRKFSGEERVENVRNGERMRKEGKDEGKEVKGTCIRMAVKGRSRYTVRKDGWGKGEEMEGLCAEGRVEKTQQLPLGRTYHSEPPLQCYV